MRRFGLCRFVAPSKERAGRVAEWEEKRVKVKDSEPRLVIWAMTGSPGAGTYYEFKEKQREEGLVRGIGRGEGRGKREEERGKRKEGRGGWSTYA